MLPVPTDETLAKNFGATWVDVNVNEVKYYFYKKYRLYILLSSENAVHVILTLIRFYATVGTTMKISKIVTGLT